MRLEARHRSARVETPHDEFSPVLNRHVTQYEELLLLKEFEKRETVFAGKVAAKQTEKTDMMSKVHLEMECFFSWPYSLSRFPLARRNWRRSRRTSSRSRIAKKTSITNSSRRSAKTTNSPNF